MRGMSLIKYWIEICVAKTFAFVFRRVENQIVRRHLIDDVYDRYIDWRRLELSARTSFGSKMRLTLPDSIQTHILLTGQWEPTITALISSALKPGDIFLDVGANVGYDTLLASHCVGDKGKVYSFEASPRIFERLRENVEINRCTNVRLFNIAVSDGPGAVSVWLAPKDNLGHSTIVDSVAQAEGHLLEGRVQCDAILQLVPLEDLFRTRFVKIDIEGAERLAIQGILPGLDRFSLETEWLVELSPEYSPGGLIDTNWVYSVFVKAGYTAYRVENEYGGVRANRCVAKPLRKLDAAPIEKLNDILFSKVRP